MAEGVRILCRIRHEGVSPRISLHQTARLAAVEEGVGVGDDLSAPLVARRLARAATGAVAQGIIRGSAAERGTRGSQRTLATTGSRRGGPVSPDHHLRRTAAVAHRRDARCGGQTLLASSRRGLACDLPRALAERTAWPRGFRRLHPHATAHQAGGRATAQLVVQAHRGGAGVATRTSLGQATHPRRLPQPHRLRQLERRLRGGG